LTFSWRYDESRGDNYLIDGASKDAVDWTSRRFISRITTASQMISAVRFGVSSMMSPKPAATGAQK